MELKQLLKSHSITQPAFGEGTALSRGAVYRLLETGVLPVRDREA